MKHRIKTLEDYERLYQLSVEHPEQFWADVAGEFVWSKPWDNVLDWNFREPRVRWFEGGKLNITENCLDRHLAERSNQVAFFWEPNDPNDACRSLTYGQLHREVCRMANVLKGMGVQKGDRVCLYMPLVPELAIGVLACARLGAVHSVVFGGFSAAALAGRIQDSECKVVLTSDGAYRGNKEIPMKTVVDEKICLWMAKNGYFYVMHRFDLDNLAFVRSMKAQGVYASISLGVKQAAATRVHTRTYFGAAPSRAAMSSRSWMTSSVARATLRAKAYSSSGRSSELRPPCQPPAGYVPSAVSVSRPAAASSAVTAYVA
jgi:hypothetical protein